MCGIAGIINKSNKDKKLYSVLKNMSNIISHRGPDQAGYLEYQNILLSHVRLPVMDPRNLGRQPMSNDNRLYIVFNGEIFNYKEIRQELIKIGYKFFSNSDTEVALNAYKEWGTKCFDKFNGDWVICFLDKIENYIIIAKDGLGTKPLYFYEDREYLSFCSEIKGFEALKSIQFNEDNLGLSNISVYSFNETKFKNISQIKPGALLKIDLKNAEKKEEVWFNPLNNLVSINPSYKKNTDNLYEKIYQATKLRLDADLKIGTSLSGGLDSSIIFATLNEIDSTDSDIKEIDLNPTIVDYKESLTTQFAIDFSELHERKFNIVKPDLNYEADSLSNLFSQLEIVDEYNKQIELYKKQKSLGIDVSIDGLGPDEFLGMTNFIPQLSFSYFNNIVDLNKINHDFEANSNIQLMEKYFGKLSYNKKRASFNFANFIDLRNYFEDYDSQTKKSKDVNNLTIIDYLKQLGDYNPDFQYTFFKTHCGYLQYFLHKWDRASMASSVEIRSPYLDKNVYLYMLSLPLEMKFKEGKIKSILSDAFKHVLPDYIIKQKFKQGLPITQKSLDDPLIKNIINEVLLDNDFNHIFLNSKKIKSDYAKNKNINVIWHIVKYYLLIKGFQNRFKNLINKNINFNTVPILGETV